MRVRKDSLKYSINKELEKRIIWGFSRLSHGGGNKEKGRKVIKKAMRNLVLNYPILFTEQMRKWAEEVIIS